MKTDFRDPGYMPYNNKERQRENVRLAARRYYMRKKAAVQGLREMGRWTATCQRPRQFPELS